jgi:hypothetical protein
MGTFKKRKNYQHRKSVKEITTITNIEIINLHKSKIPTEIELQIENITVTGDIQQTIRKESTRQEYMAHLTNTYGRQVKCAEKINWKAIEYAMSNQQPTTKNLLLN